MSYHTILLFLIVNGLYFELTNQKLLEYFKILIDPYFINMSRNKRVSKTSSVVNNEKMFFDLTPVDIKYLGSNIVHCVKTSTDLICYSSNSMNCPMISITEIPGLTDLFTQACLQHGLMGYLDWKHENNPNAQNSIILENVIIATCGKEDKRIIDNTEQSPLYHDIDNNKLTYIREKSRAKFNENLRLELVYNK
jgi:hypothetical protein